MSNGTGTKSIGGNWLSNMMLKGAKKLYNKLPESVTSAVGDIAHILHAERQGFDKEFKRQSDISDKDYMSSNSQRPLTDKEKKLSADYKSTLDDETSLEALLKGDFKNPNFSTWKEGLGTVGRAIGPFIKNKIAGHSDMFDYNLSTGKDFAGGYDEAKTILSDSGIIDQYWNAITDGVPTYDEGSFGKDEAGNPDYSNTALGDAGIGDWARGWTGPAQGIAVDESKIDEGQGPEILRFQRDMNWMTPEGYKEREKALNTYSMSSKDYATRQGKKLLPEGADTGFYSDDDYYDKNAEFADWSDPQRWAMQTPSGEFLPYDDNLTMEENLKNNPGASFSPYAMYDNFEEFRSQGMPSYSKQLGAQLEDKSANLYFMGEEGRNLLNERQDTTNMVQKSKHAPGITKNGDGLNTYQSYPLAFHLDEMSSKDNSPFADPFGYNYDSDRNTSFLEKIKGVSGLQMVNMLQDEYGYEMKEGTTDGPRVKPIGNDEDVGLGAYQQSMGFDAERNQPYFAFYDHYDLNPMGKGSGGADMGAGKPYEVYDRIYLTQDPEGNWGYDFTDVTEDDMFRNGNADKPFEVTTN